MQSGHTERVNSELKAVGVNRYGSMKFAVRYLPNVIHSNEHIHGVVYDRYADKTGSLRLNAGILVATDKRIIFLDHKPGFTDMDEISYDVVSGLKRTTAIFSALTLQTRLGDYTLRFANPKCTMVFAKYVEGRRLETNDKDAA